jgi:hypothetical protein
MRAGVSLSCAVVLACCGCSKGEKATDSPAAPASASSAAVLAPIPIPADGKLEIVRVEGVTVPMIQLMDNGQVVLVDIDGVKPRTWEAQYKRKSDLPRGYFDLHKTDANNNGRFDDDPVDKQGRWKMDDKGNIARD